MNNIHSQHRIQIAKQVLNAIQKHQKSFLKAFIVYGSTAQNSARKDSDLDIQLLVDVFTSEFKTFLQQVKAAFEEKYDLEIALNVKTVSQFMDDLWRKEPLYYFILTDGICLLNSTVFEGLQKLLLKNVGPEFTELDKVHRTGIQIRARDILSKTAPMFMKDIESIIEDYVKIKILQDNSIQKWLEWENTIDKEDQIKLMSAFENSGNTFKSIMTNIQEHKDIPESMEFVETLQILNNIFQETAEYL